MKTLYISIFNGKDWDISDRPVDRVAGVSSPSPRSSRGRGGGRARARSERGGMRAAPQRKWQMDLRKLPLTRIASAMRSDLSPQAGRGELPVSILFGGATTLDEAASST